MTTDRDALSDVLAGLRSTPVTGDLTAALENVCEAAVGVFGVSGAGMMMIDENHGLRPIAASDEPGHLLEQTQSDAGQGPCVDTLIFDTVVATEDVTIDERWPRVGPKLRDTSVRAVLGIPARAAGGAIGAFNVYRSEPHVWDGSEIDAFESFNGVVETLIGSAVLADARETVVQQLQYALENRVTIERAVGVIMGRDGVDPVTAFNTLRTQARAERRRVSELADEILARFAQGSTPRD
jgi:GAF domain-containing protein